MFVVIVVLSACQPGNMPNMRGEHFVLTPSGGEPVTGNDLLGGGAEGRLLSTRTQI
jgi:hypothetical protein